MKLVSVIIPVYNVEKYIRETITSVLNQTYTNFELLIIDDESPDNTVNIVKKFQDSRIRIIHQKNRGLAGARNTGIRNAKGDYIALLDGDDVWLPEKLAQHVEHLNKNPHIGVSFSQSLFIDDDSNSLGIYQMPKLTDITPEHLLCRNPIGNGSAPVIRQEVFAEIGFEDDRHGNTEIHYFDEDFRQSEDIECWFRIVTQTLWQIGGINQALTLYRVNESGLSASVFKQLASWEQVITKHRQINPDVVNQWEDMARAYQLRYLARRAVRLQDGALAVELVNKALATKWQILFTESYRTGLTLVAAYLLYLTPHKVYSFIESHGLKLVGKIQQLQLNLSSSMTATES